MPTIVFMLNELYGYKLLILRFIRIYFLIIRSKDAQGYLAARENLVIGGW